jgi:hypothetical protein
MRLFLLYTVGIMLLLSQSQSPEQGGCSGKSNKRESDASVVNDSSVNQWAEVSNYIIIASLPFTIDSMQDRFSLPLSDTLTVNIVIEKIQSNVNNTKTIRGRAEEYPQGILLLSSTEGESFGFLRIPEIGIDYRLKSNPQSGFIYVLKQKHYDVIERDSVVVPPQKPE